jgi:hypothetical protein
MENGKKLLYWNVYDEPISIFNSIICNENKHSYQQEANAFVSATNCDCEHEPVSSIALLSGDFQIVYVSPEIPMIQTTSAICCCYSTSYN